MRMKCLKTMAMVLGMGVALSGFTRARAEEPNAILDLLESKGLITHEEAEKAKKYYDQQQATAVVKDSKLKVGSWLDKVELYGDARLRYEWRTGEVARDNTDRDRFRFRLRFGLKGTYADNFFYGFRVESSNNARSTNLTMGDNGANPFGKANYGLYIGQVYLGWKATDWLTIIGGKQAVPFFSAPPYGAGYGFVWDPDINPEGATEQLTFKTDKVDWFVNLGEYIYRDNTENAIGGAGFSDTWLLGGQVGGTVKFDKNMHLTVAPAFYLYVNPSSFMATTNAPPFNKSHSGYPAPVNKLAIFDLPVVFAFPIGKLPAKVFGEFAVNTQGKDRADAAGAAAYDGQIYAYQAGVQLGEVKKKGDWAAMAFWEHKEEFSLDPNLVDSDIFDGRLNMEGVGVNVRYLFTDFLTGGITYAYANDIKSGLPTAGAGDLSTPAGSTMKKYDLLQVTMDWKF